MPKTLKIESTEQSADFLTTSRAKLLLLATTPFLLTACSLATEPSVVVQTEYVQQNVPLQERPKAVDFPPVDWYVITQENLDVKLAEIEAKTGEVVIFAITPKGYENLSLGIAELRRYVKDQQAIIGYYEKALTDTPPATEDPQQQ